MTDDELTKQIIGCAYKVHNALGSGFLEKVYENALRIELEKQGLRVRQQQPISVVYEGQIVGEYYANLWVDERVVLELKLRRRWSRNTRSNSSTTSLRRELITGYS